jgi:hypothetical protein
LKTILLAGLALAAVTVAADARVYHHGYRGGYWGGYGGYGGGNYITSPFFRSGLYGEPDPFIRGQIMRDIPLRDR